MLPLWSDLFVIVSHQNRPFCQKHKNKFKFDWKLQYWYPIPTHNMGILFLLVMHCKILCNIDDAVDWEWTHLTNDKSLNVFGKVFEMALLHGTISYNINVSQSHKLLKRCYGWVNLAQYTMPRTTFVRVSTKFSSNNSSINHRNGFKMNNYWYIPLICMWISSWA